MKRDWIYCASKFNIETIAEAVASASGIAVADLLGPKKARKFARPRHAVMYLAHRNTGKSTTQIGRFFNRDHTTVVYAIRAVSDRPHLYPLGEVRE